MPKELYPIEQIFPSLTWRIRHLAMYPDKAYDFVKLDNDFDGIHFGIYVDHDLAGVISLFITGDVGQFRKFAVSPTLQQNGLGTQLLHYVIDFCKVQKLTKLWCNARVDAKEFYAKFGFHETETTYTKTGIDFVIMELEIK